MRLSTQVFVSHTTPEPDRIEPIMMKETFWKPRDGGLWTSSLSESGGQWVDWLLGEGFALEDERWGGALWLLEPRDANVYVIHGPIELFELVERYPHPDARSWAEKGLDTFRAVPNWPKVATDYDAVTIPNPWPWRFGCEDHAASMFFYTLDAESTCWFRWCFEDDPKTLDPATLVRSID